MPVPKRLISEDIPKRPIDDDSVVGGFISKIGESFTRGQDQTLAGLGIYEALENPTVDLEGALLVRRKLQRKETLQPLESNWLSDIVYSSARTAGQIWESSKRGGVGGVVGAGIGALAGAGIGALIPTVGEEPVTALAGAKVGLKLGAAEAAGLFAYRTSVGEMYGDMLDQNVDPEIANQVSHIAGIPFALVEMLQLKALTPEIKKGLTNTLGKITAKKLGALVAKKYAGTLSKEVLEEVGQEIIQIGAEDIAKELSGQGVHINADYIKERANRVWDITKGATKGFALLPIPGTAIEAAVGMTSADIADEIRIAKESETNEVLKPEDLNSPLGKVSAAIKNSIDTFESQEKIRKKERAVRAEGVREVRETETGADWRYKAKSHLKGEYAKLGIEPLQSVIPEESYEALSQELRTSPQLDSFEAIRLGDALENLFKKGKIFTPSEVELSRKQWGDNFANLMEEAAEKTKAIQPTKFEQLNDFLTLPKATAASMDLSRTGRQNILLIGKPKQWLKALKRDWSLLLNNEGVARKLENQRQLELDKKGDLINKSGIRINQWGKDVSYRRGAERFASRFAKRIPGIERSERAYSAGGNLLRMDLLNEIADNRKGLITTPKEWKDLGHVINILTGEGDARKFGKLGPALNAVFFAPRLLEARVRAFTDIFNPKLSGVARKMLAYHVVSFVGTNLGILGLAAATPGLNVETDYRSTDFGKIRRGRTRVDFWGGYLPLARLVMRLISGEVKTQGGRVIPVDIKDTLASFLQSKLGPAPAYVLDLVRGQTFYGDYVGLDADSTLQQFYNRFTPFFLQDLVDAIRYQGLGTVLATAPLAFHGVGVQTYPMSKNTEALSYKNKISSLVMGDKWDNLSPEIQKYLKASFPEIEQKERQAGYDSTNYDFLAKIAEQRDKTGQRMLKSLPRDVQLEFANLGIKVSGISRTIGSDWYLNDKRYKQYELQTLNLYKKILPNLIRAPFWDNVPIPIKIQLLNEVMTELKQNVREDIMMRANFADVAKLRNVSQTIQR